MKQENGTVLVIDDIALIRNVISSFLTDKQYMVYEASNIEEALATYNAHKIDIVITDMIMPHGGGVRLIMDLKLRNPDVKIIAMSGAYSKDKFLEVAKSFGAHEILRKPFKTNELSEAVDRVLSLNSCSPEPTP